MIRKYILPILAMTGMVVIAIAIVMDNQPTPAPPPIPWPQAPFPSYIAGSGLVEASGGNIAVGTPTSGIVTNIYIKWGDQVKKGDPLFRMDDSDLQARLQPALASVNEYKATLFKDRQQLKFAEAVADSRAFSREELSNRRAAVAIAESALTTAQARVHEIELGIQRRTVRALMPGQILQINMHPGEFAAAGILNKPLILLGNTSTLNVRIDIDEIDAARVKAGAAAVAFLRGMPHQPIKLKFERIEPYVIPKVQLTGNSMERVDTRVLQVIYSFDNNDTPVYTGQQMDVYIEAASTKSSYPTSHQPERKQ
jgi:RND family efflux transporter MFP subunit